MNKYFYSVDGVKTTGPVNFEELKEFYRAGEIPKSTLYAHNSAYDENDYSSWFTFVPFENEDLTNKPKTYADLLHPYVGGWVSVNIDSQKFEAASLVFVGADFLSIRPLSSEMPIHYPLSSVLSLREWSMTFPYEIHRPIDSTIKQGAFSKIFSGKIESRLPEFIKVSLTTRFIIEIYHNIDGRPKGSGGIGVGFSIPIG